MRFGVQLSVCFVLDTAALMFGFPLFSHDTLIANWVSTVAYGMACMWSRR